MTRSGIYEPLAEQGIKHDLIEHMNISASQKTEQASPHKSLSAVPASSFIGTSAVMQALYEQIEHAARSNAPVFIMGETGTGKDVCAESIHRHSQRQHKPFIAINCAAIPRDLLESELFGHVKGAFTGAISDRQGAATMANGGTLFLDEIAEMAPDMQTKLLRFLQDSTFRKVGGGTLEKADVRIICATNRDPQAEIAAGRLRADLFFRLHVIPLFMPPLCERGDDVLDIAHALLRRYSEEENKGFRDFSPETRDFLRQYRWPGNVRQLQNVIRYICVMHEGDSVDSHMLPHMLLQPDQEAADRAPSESAEPAAVSDTLPDGLGDMTLAEIEKYFIEQAIQRTGGNVPQAAARLGVAPSTLYRKRLSWTIDDENMNDSTPRNG